MTLPSYIEVSGVRNSRKALQSLNHIGARRFPTSDVILLLVCANVDVIATATLHTPGLHVGFPGDIDVKRVPMNTYYVRHLQPDVMGTLVGKFH